MILHTVLILTVFAVLCVGESNYIIQWKILPAFFKRKFQVWAKSESCPHERIKSIESNVSLTWINNEPAYSITTKLATDDQDMKKAELLLEFHDLPTRRAAKLRKQKKLTVSVLLSRNGESGLNLTGPISAVFVNANLLELTCDITESYNKSKQNLLEEIDLNVKILRKGGKTLKSLMRRNVKAFVLVYEKVRSCDFMDFLRRDARYRRSLDSTPVEKATQTEKSMWTYSPKSEHCFVKEQKIDFQDVGLDWIFHPVSYNMGTCGGKCSIRNYHSGYKLLESIFNEKTNRGPPSACQPVEFGSMPIIYSDHSDKRPVIAKFTHMVVKQCGCT